MTYLTIACGKQCIMNYICTGSLISIKLERKQKEQTTESCFFYPLTAEQY